MAWYRKTTPSSYTTVAASNFTDSSKHWRKYKNAYIRTDDMQTLANTGGRYSDSSKSWRRVKAMYKFNGTIWQQVFAKFAGQPYPNTPPYIRYNDYDGLDIYTVPVIMGPGSSSIAQGASGITYLWGKDGQDWQNLLSGYSRNRTFMVNDIPVYGSATAVTNDEGYNEGDKLRNVSGIIDVHDGKYLWYRDTVTNNNGST